MEFKAYSPGQTITWKRGINRNIMEFKERSMIWLAIGLIVN